MTLLVDTSVVVKWFHEENESEIDAARAIRSAHEAGEIVAGVLDLGVLELGSVLVRTLRWSGERVAAQIDDLLALCGPSIRLDQSVLAVAARLADERGLSFYDACWAAAARHLGVPLVSADRELLAAGLAESATAAATRLGLLS